MTTQTRFRCHTSHPAITNRASLAVGAASLLVFTAAVQPAQGQALQQALPIYELVDLGPNTAAWDINDENEVCGEFLDAGAMKAGLWKPSGELFRSMNPFGANVAARGIDNAGNLALGASMTVVPINSNNDDGEGTSSFYDAASNAVFQLSPGLGPDLPNGGSTWTSSKFIGWDVGGGRMVGDYKHNNLGTSAEHFNPLYWIVSPLNQAGLELPYHRNDSQDHFTRVRRVNERGWAVGCMSDNNHITSRYQAALWVPEAQYDGTIEAGHSFDGSIGLRLIGGDTEYIAYGINDKLPPTIVGDFRGTAHRWVWQAGLDWPATNSVWNWDRLTLGNFNPRAYSRPKCYALDVNDGEVIVGTTMSFSDYAAGSIQTGSFRDHRHPRFNPSIPFAFTRFRMYHVAWVWDTVNGFKELQTLIQFTDEQKLQSWDITQAVGISDDGWIAANAVATIGGTTTFHAILLRPPAPPPTSLLLMVR